MRTSVSEAGNPEGMSPKLVVKTCDGQVKFNDAQTSVIAQGESKSWEIPNFDTETDMIEFETVGIDGWMVKSMEMQICDSNGVNCQTQVVQEDYNIGNGMESRPGNAFWIDGDCDSSGIEEGCHATFGCNCYTGNFFLKQDGKIWSLDNNFSTCDLGG